MTPGAEGTHAISGVGASPCIFHWEGTSDTLISVGIMGNKGEEQYHGSCNGRSDFFAISTSTAVGISFSSAMDLTK